MLWNQAGACWHESATLRDVTSQVGGLLPGAGGAQKMNQGSETHRQRMSASFWQTSPDSK